MPTPDPSQVAPWYLRNINQALQLDEATGNVFLRTGIQGNVYITGPVTIPGEVTVTSTAENPVHVHLDEIGTSGILNVPYMPIGNTNVAVTGGNITVAGNVGIIGNVAVTQSTSPWSVVGNVAASLTGNALPDGKPWELQVAQGLVPGVTGLSISGYGAAIGTSFIPAWELNTDYTYLPSAQVVRVWSSSASDTNVSVLISGLDANYVQQTETVVLTNGATGVLSTKQFLRINNISITGTVQNVGSISVGNSGKTITSAYVGNATNVTAGRSQMSVYTVPAGYTFYLTQSNWYTNQVGSQTALYRSWTRSPTGIVSIVLTFPIQQLYNSTKVVPRPYPEKTDIQWQVASSTNNSQIGGQIEGYLIAN